MPILLGLTATEVDDKPLATTADSLDSPRGMFVVFHEGRDLGGGRALVQWRKRRVCIIRMSFPLLFLQRYALHR